MRSNDFVSIDDWKPTERNSVFRNPSEWRKLQNSKYFDVLPDSDDLRKIKAHLKANISKDEIIKIFGISSLTFKRIKLGKYSMHESTSFPPTKDEKKEIFGHVSRLYQDIKEDVMIEYNITASMFDAILKEFDKSKKKVKIDLIEEDGE